MCRLPFRLAAAKVVFEAGGGLVAVLGALGEELHHDRRDRAGDAAEPFGGCLRPPGEVAVHPFHRVGRDERQGTDEHPVEGDPEGVEVAAGVDRAVHAAGLLGRHVGEGAGDGLGRLGRLALAHEARGDAEAGQAHRAGGLVEHDVGRLDVLVDEAGLVEPVHGRCDGDREVEEAPRLHRCSEHPVEGLARVLEDQGGPAAVVHEVEGPDGPGRVEPLPEAILVGEAIEGGAGRGIEGRLHDQDGLAPAVADRSANRAG